MSETKKNRAEQQAAAQLSSIREMVAALTMETAAKYYVSDLTAEECMVLLFEDKERPSLFEEDVEELREMVADQIVDGTIDPSGFTFDGEEARQAIQEDPLSIEMRSDWVTSRADMKPAEFKILLCTGGPAVRIVGDLESPQLQLQYQDWFEPWRNYPLNEEEELDVTKYAQQFYFGE